MPGGFAYAREFFKRYYTPDNATVIVAGDFDKKATLAHHRRRPMGLEGQARPRPRFPSSRRRRRRAARISIGRCRRCRALWLVWHTPGSDDLKAQAVQTVLNAYLFGKTSPLYQDLVLGRQLVDSLEPSWDRHRDPSLFGAYARVRKASDLGEVEQTIAREVGKLAAGAVDAQRLDAVRSNLKYRMVLSLDTANRVAVTLATTAAQTGDLESINKLFARIDALTPAELVAFAKTNLTDANRTTVTLTSTAEVKK